jgi:ArsR family transcriptional regulator
MRDVASFFKVFSDEARIEMLWLLFNHKELCVCDFMEVLRITQSKASRHLRILYGAGLVDDRREGLWVYYRLRPLPAGPEKDHMEQLRAHLASRRDATRLLRQLATWLRRKRAEPRCAGKPAIKRSRTIKAAAGPGGRRS